MSWEPLTLADVDLVAPPVEPSIGGLTYPGSRLLVSGEPESLKSWLAAVMAVERVRLGERVVWCDFEQGPAVTRSRFVDLGLADEGLARVLYLAPREPLEAEARELLRRQLEEARPTVAVFDAYAGLLGVHDLDPDSSRDIERVNRLVVDVFRANGATVAILDHVVKAKDSRSRYSSGSGRKLAEVEVHLGLERVAHFKRGGAGSARIRNHKDRLGGLPYPLVGELHVTSDPTSGRVESQLRPPGETHADTGEAGGFRPTGYMERVSVYLELRPEPVTRRAVETDVTGKAEWVRQALDVLTRERYVVETPGARGARLVESVKPYREADDLVPDTGDDLGTSSHADSVETALDLVLDGSHE